MTSKYYSGKVSSVTYENADNAFYILKMVLDEMVGTTTVKGTIPGLKVQIGSWFGFEGRWVSDPKYGSQMLITRAPALRGAWDAKTAAKVLTSNGVGINVMKSIQEHFDGESALEALSSVEKLMAVPGLTEVTAQHIVSRWEMVKGLFQGMTYLSQLGLPAGVVKSVWAKFGEKALSILAENPWSLVEVDGVTFAHADEVARRSGLDNPKARLQGAVLYACKSSRQYGHLFLRTGGVLQTVQGLIGEVEVTQVAQALVDLSQKGLVVIDRRTRPGTAAVYEPWCYETETESARLLLERVQKAAWVPDEPRTVEYLQALGDVGPLTAEAVKVSGAVEPVIRTAIEEWGSQAHLSLSAFQKEGIYHALSAPVSVLSGLPGTGKTTSLKAAVRILQDAGVPFLLAAPTGIAAKNLSLRTGAMASTLHRAFAAKGSREATRESAYVGVLGEAPQVQSQTLDDTWGYSESNPHPADVVIIDEASMMDQYLLCRLLACTKPEARLVFVGDHAQLPSVGPGNVLRHLIEANICPVVKLTQIFRQEDTSGIVYAAHAIHAGEVPEFSTDFSLRQWDDDEDVLGDVLDIAKKNFDAKKNFQIITPRHAGVVGVTNLNSRLRELINPGSSGLAEARLGDDTIREGDRIMITQNNYKLGVFNGDVGKVSRVDRLKKEVELLIYGDMSLRVTVPFKDAGKLIRLAYACTVHKSQGLEYDIVVLPIVSGFGHQLQRNLLYTAITRARKQVVLVGQRNALVRAVFNAKEDERNSLFLDRLHVQGV